MWKPLRLSLGRPFASGSFLPISFHVLKQLGMGLAELERKQNIMKASQDIVKRISVEIEEMPA